MNAIEVSVEGEKRWALVARTDRLTEPRPSQQSVCPSVAQPWSSTGQVRVSLTHPSCLLPLLILVTQILPPFGKKCLLMNPFFYLFSVEGAQELPNFEKNNQPVPIFMGSGKSGF